MRRRRKALDGPTQARHAFAFRERMIQTPVYQRSRRIACYSPVSGELDTHPLMAHALETGREVYLPVIVNHQMWFSQWRGEPLPVDRASGLPQPLKRAPRLANVRRLDLVILPLVAFSPAGDRLGQGGGYYDDLFAFQNRQQWRRPVMVGAAHDVQQCITVPSDAWDVSLAGIVTNRNSYF